MPAPPFTRFGTHLATLLPPGKLWNLEPNSVLRRLLVGTGDEFQRVEDRGAALVEESDPSTATETLADWERVLSLPDEQVPVIPATPEGRRAAIVSKLVGRGGQNYAFFDRLVTACGYVLDDIVLFPVLREGFRVDDRCFDSTFAYAMEVKYSSDPGTALSDADFRRVIRARTHAHIQVVFTEV